MATAETDRASDPGAADRYSEEDRPLRAYAGLTAAFVAAFAGSLAASRAAGKELPEKFEPWDLVIAGAATHKISRLITRDKVTSFLRAPFVRYQEPSGRGEVEEKVRGEGLQRAVGELLACPYCIGQWTAAGFGVGMVAAPRLTRLVGFVFAAETVGDFLQLAYLAAEERASTG